MPQARNSDGDGDGLAVYVHWPFCLSKCPYCDFNSHVAGEVDQDRWRRALIAEIDHASERMAGRMVTSVFFGGGTPSLMPPATVAAVIDGVAARWVVDGDVEITLEANPTSVEAGAFADIARAGVNRISLGVQALDDADLNFLGRAHSAREALDAVAVAQRVVSRTSFDMIYGRPGQSADAWRAELTKTLDHAGDHISAYQLTVEKGTPFFAAHRGGAFALPDDDIAVDLYEVTQTVLGDAGLPSYEISNHARPGEQCRHNLAYWHYRDYVGIGPGAHARLRIDGAIRAIENRPAPADWLEAVERTGHGARRDDAVGRQDAAAEALMMGLRLIDGIDRAGFEARTGVALENALDGIALERLVDAGLVEIDENGLRTTLRGRPLLNAILEKLIPLRAAA